MTDFIAAQADLILPELVGGYAPEYVIFTIVLCAIALVINSMSWFFYRKKTDEESREKEGWNSFYLVSSFLILIVLISRIEKL